MRILILLTAVAMMILAGSPATAATITGEYLEARTCDVYTGPCFANAEMGLAGKEAVMAWKVEKGTWRGVPLDGLGAALILSAQNTLGNDGIFDMKAGKISSMILVDRQANQQQHEALVAFVKDSARKLTKNVVGVQRVPFSLENDHITNTGVFQAGKLARIETRAIEKSDCVCTNEVVYYQPLTKVDNSAPAFSKTISFQGKGLNNRWRTHGTRSAFLATFRR